MPVENPQKQRRWRRQPAAMPIRLVLKADHFKRDDAAIAILDISLRGVGVRTSLALGPRESVGVVPKEDLPLPSRPGGLGARGEAAAWTLAGLEL